MTNKEHLYPMSAKVLISWPFSEYKRLSGLFESLIADLIAAFW